MNWGKEVEKKIQEALESGAFENLPGKGEPLSLDQNPYEDPSWRLAFHLLKSNEFTLPWLEKRREIEDQIGSARAGLIRAWENRQTSQAGSSSSAGNWEGAVALFRQQVVEINRQIRSYNLQAPSDRLHLFVMDADAEIERLEKSSDQKSVTSSLQDDPLQS